MGGRVEVITGPERRRRWSSDEKLQLVEEACRPGLSVSLVARRHGINPSQLFAWRRQALAEGLVTDSRSEPAARAAVTFAPVAVIAGPAEPEVEEKAHPARQRRGTKPTSVIEIELKSGDRVRVEGCADIGALVRIICALRRA